MKHTLKKKRRERRWEQKNEDDKIIKYLCLNENWKIKILAASAAAAGVCVGIRSL